MQFNENSRVKIPTILHLTRLGYVYLSKNDYSNYGKKWDSNTNIFDDIFIESIIKINNRITENEAKKILQNVKLSLDNDDLGKEFYQKLTQNQDNKLIDFDDFSNNSFHVITELTYKNGDDEFRPDITLLINGMPLFFIEVKIPNNKDGILAEKNRINKRFENYKFKRFFNITQIMVFSNNMEYDDNDLEQLQGAFYGTPSYPKPILNYFREEENFDLTTLLKSENNEIENIVLKDNNLITIKSSNEFITNKDPNTPTNKICTSLFSMDRLAFILKYGFAYVNSENRMDKHIMRYPQIFATKAIEKKLNEGVKKGIIWHTQGSGKTALAFYNVNFLTQYYQKKSITPKFYFIVDRLDLLTQASREFSGRGLVVNKINSRQEFIEDIKTTKAFKNNSGNLEITVVNIQKFANDSNIACINDYQLNIQRIYFLDEVHRSYNPTGSFLANLIQSDPNSIKIGLTGTPLLGEENNSKSIFGNYIHKYYYNSSIADGYTLRLIREEIATKYRLQLKQALENIEIQKNNIEAKEIYAHSKFVEPMLDYIIQDFENSRIAYDDNSIGAMVICDSSNQAEKMYEIFNQKYNISNPQLKNHQIKSVALILHDSSDKDDIKQQIADFKNGKIDLLFVYNMLLTGFDAPRLKKLYLGRVIKDHNLLQALTRVNRRYKKFRYGYVVDFADIRTEFDKANKAYLEELKSEVGDEFNNYSLIFKIHQEIEQEIEEIKNVLFRFNTQNCEIFSQQIRKIDDQKIILSIKKSLEKAKELSNIIRFQNNHELTNKLDFKTLNKLYVEVKNHLDILNLKENFKNNSGNINLINIALEDIIFMFYKNGEEELIISDKLRKKLTITKDALINNFDQKDPQFISLKEEFERIFKKKNITEVSQENMNQNIIELDNIISKIKELNHQNSLLKAKYHDDYKFTRIHKRILENNLFLKNEREIFDRLNNVKQNTDELFLQNQRILQNESYFNREIARNVAKEFSDSDQIKFISNLITKEYQDEFKQENNL